LTRAARKLLGLISLGAAILLLAGCSTTTANGLATGEAPVLVARPSTTDFAKDFVTVRGRSFELAGKAFQFVGANIYDAAASSRYSCRSGSEMSAAELLATLRYLHDVAGATVLRFWAYQTYTQAGTYWNGVDRVLADAREVGMKVIPVLEDGPGNCTTTPTASPKSQYEGDTWYSRGYKVPYGNAALSYRDYVKVITAHYANNPTILGWSMMNEADTEARASNGASVLVGFATDIASVIRSVDKRHLITVGTQSNGAPGASGPDFTAVYKLPVISFAEVHDWGYWGSDVEPMPGGKGSIPPSATSAQCARTNASIGCSFARAETLDKPLIVGEAGMRGVTVHERTLRAVRIRAKMNADFAAGASGYLVWSVTQANTDGYDIRINTHDPLIAQMKQVADGLP